LFLGESLYITVYVAGAYFCLSIFVNKIWLPKIDLYSDLAVTVGQ
jgi:hypothetical protein